jgi:hypothetical protein
MEGPHYPCQERLFPDLWHESSGGGGRDGPLGTAHIGSVQLDFTVRTVPATMRGRLPCRAAIRWACKEPTP